MINMKKQLNKPIKLGKQAGLTLIELGLAIGISAALIVALMVVLSSTMVSRKVYSFTNQVNQIAGAVQQDFSGNGYGDKEIKISDLQSAGYIPNISATETPLGGAYKITGAGTTFTITATLTSDEGCKRLNSYFKPGASKSGTDYSVQGCNPEGKTFTYTGK